jgi:hypothetical protein
MKSFGPKGKPARPAVREQFEFTFLRDDEPETHTFNARVITDVAALSVTLTNANRHPDLALSGMFRMIAKMLDNKDGTPNRWEPRPLPKMTTEDRAAAGVYSQTEDDEYDDQRDDVTRFRGPDGTIYPLDRAADFTAFEAGSSRRRWLYLMEEDDEVIVDAKDVAALFEWLTGLAAGRPTQPPS